MCFSGAGQRAPGERQVAEGPPGQRRPHREAEGGNRLAEQSESSQRSFSALVSDILSVPLCSHAWEACGGSKSSFGIFRGVVYNSYVFFNSDFCAVH